MKLTQGLYFILVSPGRAYIEHNPPPSLDDGLQLECILDSMFLQSSAISKTCKRGDVLMSIYLLSTLCHAIVLWKYFLGIWDARVLEF